MVSVDFAINHMSAPQLALADFFARARKPCATRVELRNKLAGNAIADGTSAEAVLALAHTHGITVTSINARRGA